MVGDGIDATNLWMQTSNLGPTNGVRRTQMSKPVGHYWPLASGGSRRLSKVERSQADRAKLPCATWPRRLQSRQSGSRAEQAAAMLQSRLMYISGALNLTRRRLYYVLTRPNPTSRGQLALAGFEELQHFELPSRDRL